MAAFAPADMDLGDLPKRTATAGAAGAVALAAILAEGWWLAGFGLALTAILIHEWILLTLPEADKLTRVLQVALYVALAAALLAAVVGDKLGAPANSDRLMILGVAAIAMLAGAQALIRRRFGATEGRLLHNLWSVWFLPPLLALLWLSTTYGILALLFPVAIVIAADVGAYFVGRAVGGPRLAPRISPGKTWSGLIGGLVAAGVVGLLFAIFAYGGGGMGVVAVAVAVALAGAAGDLAESAVKRRAGVKDSGALFPGHGGAFDRLDSHLFALPVFALIAALAGWPL